MSRTTSTSPGSTTHRAARSGGHARQARRSGAPPGQAGTGPSAPRRVRASWPAPSRTEVTRLPGRAFHQVRWPAALRPGLPALPLFPRLPGIQASPQRGLRVPARPPNNNSFCTGLVLEPVSCLSSASLEQHRNRGIPCRFGEESIPPLSTFRLHRSPGQCPCGESAASRTISQAVSDL